VQIKCGMADMRKSMGFSAAGAGLLTGISVFGGLMAGLSPADARDFFGYWAEPPAYYYGYPEYPYRQRAYRPDRNTRARPAVRQQPETRIETPAPAGPHLVIVSVRSQRLWLYANGKLVAQSPVSTGTASHPTPHGVFSIIQRNRHHRSTIYSGAPMPYMQRLTWSGIALHQGALPGYPASHGCIRLPERFASDLWRTTKLGARVIVAREDTEPFDIEHPLLFQPKPPAGPEITQDLRKTIETPAGGLVHTASNSTVTSDAPAEAAAVLAEAPSSPSSAPADIPPHILDSFAQALEAKAKKAPPSGPVSVFISRKDRKLYVRQNFVPLFTAPVSIRNDNEPVGTHVFSALEKEGDAKSVRWMAVTLPGELSGPGRGLGRHHDISYDIDATVKTETGIPERVPSAASVFDRIELAPDVVARISEYVTAGASLIVSDHGLGHETGLGTDFIVVTR
jgi:hypothetical protein